MSTDAVEIEKLTSVIGAWDTRTQVEAAGYVFGGSPRIGHPAVIFSRGKFRRGIVVKWGTKNVAVEYTTETAVVEAKRYGWAEAAVTRKAQPFAEIAVERPIDDELTTKLDAGYYAATMDDVHEEALAENAEREVQAILGEIAAREAARYRLTYTPHVSEYDSAEAKAVRAPQVMEFDSIEALRAELEAHGVPARAWREGSYRFHGDVWTWETLADESDQDEPAEAPEPETSTVTGSALVRALEAVWDEIRRNHPELPAVVIITGSGLVGGLPRWGHFWAERWQDRAAEDSGGAVEIVGRKAELFVAGERLAAGAELTVQTMLHEATHALAQVRGIKDTSRQGRWHNRQFRELAEELGLAYEGEQADTTTGFSAVVLTSATRARYAEVIERLDAAIVAFLAAPGLETGTDGETGTRRVGGHGGGTGGETAKSRNNLKAVCGCATPRIIRVSRAVLESGAITCGVCGEAFTAPEE